MRPQQPTRTALKLLLILLLGSLTACGAETLPLTAPSEQPTTAAATTATPLPTSSRPPATGTPPATSTPPPAPQPTTASPPPLRLSAAAGVPPALTQAAQALALAAPEAFTWQADPAGADVTLSFSGESELATWVYAAATPFATLQDEVSSTDLQDAWQAGRLYLTPETEQLLRAAWGSPAQPAQPLPAGDEALAAALWAAQVGYDPPALTLLPFDALTPRLKVLRVDGMAPIDPAFDPAGYALSIPIYLAGDPAGVAQVLAAWPGPTTNRSAALITTVGLTGPAGMRRAVADRMDRYGINYPGEETGPVLQAVDIAHMSNENAFASDCPPADPNDSDNVCNRDEYLSLMTWMGIDVNEMTGNHLNDWGPQALLHTFDLYAANNIQTFGGGRDLASAAQPLLIEHNGNRIAFVGCNPVGPYQGWARADYPGALPCDDYSAIKAEIGRLAAAGYQVIATIQYLEDYQYAVLDEQRQAFDGLAAAGAAVVSGSHAHHPQGFAFASGQFVHYGLGNLLADQMWSLGSRQMFIDTYTFYEGRLLNVDLWTGINEDYARVRRMTPAERQALLQAVFEASFWE